MKKLKKSLDIGGPCILEMPSGTGKTVTLLSFITSYKAAKPETGKLVYCSRTISEIEKAVEEAKIVIAYRQQELGNQSNTLCLALSSRKNLCIHNEVLQASITGSDVDSKCRDLINPWVRDIEDLPHCSYFENYERDGKETILKGVYSLDDLKEEGSKRGWCPYFFARKMVNFADIVIFSYQYIIDPKISSIITNEFSGNSIVVFDEAHNIDSVCIESMSVTITKQVLEGATKNLAMIDSEIQKVESITKHRLEDEYRRLVEGLELPRDIADDISNPVLPEDTVKEMVPGNIRKSRHFLGFLRRIIEYLKNKLEKPASEIPRHFLFQLVNKTQIDPHHLRFCISRLRSLLNTLQVSEIHQYIPISNVCDFATMIGTYSKGFIVITEKSITDPKSSQIQLCCLDASLGIKHVLEKYKSTVITSGTLSPLDMYPKMLNFKPIISERFKMTLHRPCLLPLIVTKGSDQVAISTRNDIRKDRSVTRNYGNLLVEMCSVVPDGIVCFFTSYKYLGDIVYEWNEMGILTSVLSKKLLFIETSDVKETSLALDNYRKACDSGRGAVLFSVARGKVSEGIDFDHHYGRCVILFGIPYVFTESPVLKARLEYLRDQYGIKEGDFLTFDAMRTAAQCVGRVIRGKSDYGVMIFADKRYSRADKRDKLPKWVSEQLLRHYFNLSTDATVSFVAQFLREMAQPISKDSEIGKSLWTVDQIPAPPREETNNNIITSNHVDKMIVIEENNISNHVNHDNNGVIDSMDLIMD